MASIPTSPTHETPTQPRPRREPLPRPTTQMTVGCVVIPIIVAAILAGGFFWIRSGASDQLTVPPGDVMLVRAAPDTTAPLLARFGPERAVTITGRSDDWRWLEVALWDGQTGWTLRPLDILVWRIVAEPTTVPTVDEVAAAPVPTPVAVADEMVAIPATTFTMGSPPGLGEADERPARPVQVSAFEIDRTEVTVGHYWDCVIANACAPPVSDASQGNPYYNNTPANDNHPVLSVTWTEANNYCQWQGKRLPTEAEWELAAGWDAERGAKYLWPGGNDPTQYRANLREAGLGQPVVVGSMAEDVSPWGVLDMSGNVSEWVFDWYKVDYYQTGDDTDPIGPTQRRGEGRGRVVRGGSFADPSSEARTANRRHQDEAYGYQTVGFRCARDVDESLAE